MRVFAPLVALMLVAAGTFSTQVSGASAVPRMVACGGVGADAREQLAAQGRGANLVLEFFVANRGDYVADVDVSLTPLDRGNAQPLSLSADGPLCYVGVRPGRYRIDAEFNGVTRSARATVPAAGPVRVAIAFPETAAHGDLDIRPTPEEKQEAKTP